jgi:hypothetical protein
MAESREGDAPAGLDGGEEWTGWLCLPCLGYLGEVRLRYRGARLWELRVDDVWVFVPVVDTDQHLGSVSMMARVSDERAYLSERGQPGQDAAPYPGGVLPLRRRKDLDPHVLHC